MAVMHCADLADIMFVSSRGAVAKDASIQWKMLKLGFR